MGFFSYVKTLPLPQYTHTTHTHLPTACILCLAKQIGNYTNTRFYEEPFLVYDSTYTRSESVTKTFCQFHNKLPIRLLEAPIVYVLSVK